MGDMIAKNNKNKRDDRNIIPKKKKKKKERESLCDNQTNPVSHKSGIGASSKPPQKAIIVHGKQMNKKGIEKDETIKKQPENIAIDIQVNPAHRNKKIAISAPEKEHIRKTREYEEKYEVEKSITVFGEITSSDSDLSDISMVSVDSDENELSETALSMSSMANVNPGHESVELGIPLGDDCKNNENSVSRCGFAKCEHSDKYDGANCTEKKHLKETIKVAGFKQFSSVATGNLVKNRSASFVSQATTFEKLLKSKKCTNVFTINVQHFEKIVKLFTKKYNLTTEELSTLFKKPARGDFIQERQQKYDEEKQKYFMFCVRLDCTGDQIIGMVCRKK